MGNGEQECGAEREGGTHNQVVVGGEPVRARVDTRPAQQFVAVNLCEILAESHSVGSPSPSVQECFRLAEPVPSRGFPRF